MEQSIIIAGFGGQGVLFAGKLLAQAGMKSGRHVTWIPSYGPEMRGGTANCTIIISDEPIGAPIVSNPDIAVALNKPSYEKYEPLVQPGGLLIVNSSIVVNQTSRDDMDIVYIPASAIADELGATKMLNMVVVGVLLAHRPVVPLAAVEEVLANELSAKKSSLLETNLTLLQKGFHFNQSTVESVW